MFALCDAPHAMADTSETLAELRDVGAKVQLIMDGDDPDWATWYANWLLELSELSNLLGARPVRSHLVHALVELDREHTASGSDERWEDVYAHGLLARFGTP